MTRVTLAILAGGAGTRMGLPKAQLRIGDRSILEYLLDRFGWPGPTLVVTTPGREHPPGADRFDCEAIDAVPDQGPLRGMLTAIHHARTDIMLITTVDMPLISREQLVWLAERLADSESLGVMLKRPFEGKDLIEPFPFACRSTAADCISRRLAQQRRSVASLATTPGFAVESAPARWPAEVWTNLNWPVDFAAFMEKQDARD